MPQIGRIYEAGETEAARAASDDDAEPLIGGVIDLGALATEFLILGLDPYPRKPGAVFQPPQEATPDAESVRRSRGTQEGPGWPLIAVVSGRRTAILAAVSSSIMRQQENRAA